MRCLVFGGTGFLGGAIVDALRSDGHDVAILTRGQTQPVRAPQSDDRPQAEHIIADRYEDLSALKDRPFDWVFDTCAYAPAAVETLLTALSGKPHYVLISSISAYGSFADSQISETTLPPEATAEDLHKAASLPPKDRASAAAYGASYGPLKYACEQQATALWGDRVTALRLGLLVGAGDYSDRLTWWVRRLDVARGEEQHVPIPGPADRSVQMIDVRDVARFALLCAAQSLPGAWNVTGRPIVLRDLLAEMADLSGTTPTFAPLDPDTITQAGIAPWSDLPLMVPPGPAFRHFLNVSTAKAEAAGLTCRPLRDTLAPLLEWDRARRDTPLKCGLSPEQEARLLATTQ